MTRLTKTTLFKSTKPRAETPMDKTTRAVTEILGEETEKRRIKTDRLRKARLEREANTLAETPTPTAKPSTARKKSPAKAARKS
ncbi:hypothetical protein [Sulfitobacter sp. MF3-043]|uniref:hypothetical protein n=1 Tax=Sulfitobacter sediminivivens TaxID=3252902 RepID=UPI0036DF6005